LVDGVAFFKTNVRTLKFQMNDSDSWSSPSVDETVTFDLVSGEVDEAPKGNAVRDVSLLAGYDDHALAGYYLRVTESGAAEEGSTWAILDNVGDYIFLDTEDSHSIANSDAFVIFQDHMAKTITGGVYRYIRILIEDQETAAGYYEIGSMIAGRTVELSKGWSIGYGLDRDPNIDFLRTPAAALIPVKKADPKNTYNLTWRHAEDTRGEILSLFDHLEGKNAALIPDSDSLGDTHLVKMTSRFQQAHRFQEKFDLTITLEEVL